MMTVSTYSVNAAISAPANDPYPDCFLQRGTLNNYYQPSSHLQ